jgi:two-component system nitrogen regulation response regulator GlnG
VLKLTGGNQSQASRILGITRGSLRNKIHTHSIQIDNVIHIDEDSEEEDTETTVA